PRDPVRRRRRDVLRARRRHRARESPVPAEQLRRGVEPRDRRARRGVRERRGGARGHRPGLLRARRRPQGLARDRRRGGRVSARAFPALGFDPAPGTLSSAESVAEQVRTTAANIREAADVLGGTGQQNWQGETATAFHETMSGELTPRVVTAADSFEAAAAALETWASSLVTFQQQAEDLETRAATAITNVSNAADDLTAAQQSEDPDVDTDGPANQLTAATGELEQIRLEAQGLAETYAGEAEYVASCLSCAADDAPDS